MWSRVAGESVKLLNQPWDFESRVRGSDYCGKPTAVHYMDVFLWCLWGDIACCWVLRVIYCSLSSEKLWTRDKAAIIWSWAVLEFWWFKRGKNNWQSRPISFIITSLVPCLGWCHAESQSAFIVYIAGVWCWRLAGTLPCPRLCRVLWSQSHRFCQSGWCLVARFLLRREGWRALSCYRSVLLLWRWSDVATVAPREFAWHQLPEYIAG